ncbi:uncharacterized protein LOC133030852 [Cannabis sativa]|uniref:Uncharacterized protein n=1 Tax=Cannabis sativa TaxID=3483 RepID=A0A7J6FN73_CANSA|nr:uncharacterized protein LOC133030852 [Cannabis sativa]KAF4350485.1 hypothetical protein F8388_014946 [Cannabis sativa]KAF4351637.1 hypothetical protein F8388_003290 [Cannabis sativa]KAF4371309.1 hypothetical protein G4B88_003779 [Cannabis sativa]
MASLATHLSAFLFLIPTGLRRLLCSSSLYLKTPSIYKSKTWFFSEPRWKNLDFYILIIALPLSSFSETFIFLTFSSGHPTYRFAFLQQSMVVFLFWVLLLLIILRENVDPLYINEAFVFIFAGLTFLAEYFVMGKGLTGLSSTAYDLLGALTLVCAGCSFYLSVKPSAFFAEFLLSTGLVFKGTWILQSGLSLYTDTFGFKGCQKVMVLPGKENADMGCDLEEDGFRAVALMRLLFTGHAILVLLLSFGLFGLLSKNQNLRFGDGGGPLLSQVDSENMLMRTSAELEIE